MWQLLLTAAIAGSTGFLAKHIFSSHYSQIQKHEEENHQDSTPAPALHSPLLSEDFPGFETNCDREGGIFRFSSTASGPRGKKKNTTSTNFKKKSGVSCRRLKFGVDKDERCDRVEVISGRNLCDCLKKRRTGKLGTAKGGSCSSKDSSLFGWGLGVGIMYIISAGKAEINKLSTTMDETSKVVEELRTELYKRKSSQVATSSKKISAQQTQLVVCRTSIGDRDPNYVNKFELPMTDVKMFELPMTDDVECPSSVLTEEQEPSVLEMDRLEAELESELQKLPWSSIKTSGHEVTRLNVRKAEDSSGGLCELEGHNAVPFQCHGVLPSELDNRLCHLLIEQQENQIMGLESELHAAQSKLQEKEAELQALKDCVRRLTDFSLSIQSEDEVEGQPEQEFSSGCDDRNKMGSESRKPAIGMKRSIDSA